MEAGIILYQSKYGSTKKYAEWLKNETGFDCIETKNAAIKQVVTYNKSILGGGIYASGIAGLSFIKKNYAAKFEKNMKRWSFRLIPLAHRREFEGGKQNGLKTHNA